MTGNEHKGAEPVLWGILNPDTGRWRSGVFGVEASAKTYARRGTDNYTKLVAVPLFTAEALATKDAELSALRDDLRSANARIEVLKVQRDQECERGNRFYHFMLSHPDVRRLYAEVEQAALTHQEKDAQDV